MAVAVRTLLEERLPVKRERPAFGMWLTATRKRKRFSGPELAAASGLSKGYINQLEVGYDPRTGKALEPTPRVIRMLAEALGEGEPAEAGAYYREMMSLAGYLPTEYFPGAAAAGQVEQDIEEIMRRLRLLPEDERERLKHYLEVRAELANEE